MQHDVIGLRAAARDVLGLIERQFPEPGLDRLQGHFHRQHLADIILGQKQEWLRHESLVTLLQ